jgi:hypothetical protein
MIHDDLLNGFKTIDKEMSDIFIGETKDWATFYFNSEDLGDGENLKDTAWDFYRQGILKIPFDKTLFVFNNYFNYPKADHRRFILCMKPTPLMFSNKKADYIFFEGVFNDEGDLFYKPYIGQLSKEYGVIHKGAYNDPITIKSTEVAADILLSACVMLGTNCVEKTYFEIPAKINKKREKKNKPPLNDYTIVNLKNHRSEKTQSTGSHASPKAHWRRGHIRTLRSGKSVAVQPCLVNFTDEIPAKGVYFK